MIRHTVFLALWTVAAWAHAAPANPRLAVQLYSVKDELKRDVEGTLARLARLGFQGVEFAGEFGPYKDNPGGLKALLDKHQLQCAGAHTLVDELRASRLDATTRFYGALGCDKLIIPFDQRAFTIEGAPGLAQELSTLAGKLAAKGMRPGYHNHAEEFAGAPGKTPWDVLAASTPDAVILQQDVGWTTFAGKDPVAYVKKYPGRTVSTHFKAKLAPGVAGMAIIGQDTTDWMALLEAVRSVGGTEWIVIEQEEYPNGMGQLDSVAASLKGLKAIIGTMPGK